MPGRHRQGGDPSHYSMAADGLHLSRAFFRLPRRRVARPHETYIEPFLGGGAIMRLKRPAKENIGLDLDPAVIQIWHCTAETAIVATATNGEWRRSLETAMAAVSTESGDARSVNAETGDGPPAGRRSCFGPYSSHRQETRQSAQ